MFRSFLIVCLVLGILRLQFVIKDKHILLYHVTPVVAYQTCFLFT